MPADSEIQPAVELTGVSRLFGNFAALRTLSMRVHAGASVLLLGENGAGKSTLLRLIAGLIPPSEGSVRVLGGTARAAHQRMAFMSHAPMLYDELTGLENLHYFAALYGTDRSGAERALRDVGLDPQLPRHVRDYSQGMRQRASLARVLMLEPDLLLLDEPFSNMDIASVQMMVTRLREFLARPGRNGAPRTLFITTHQADLARPLATTILTLTQGQLATAESAARN
ncbi:MAG TPA: ABC transporter ATP-binding protein [Candidatus Aquilonibacter sp.]|nr:ABC transporter ATP-binding protein [Candidatus Aquilonibacter sp.]